MNRRLRAAGTCWTPRWPSIPWSFCRLIWNASISSAPARCDQLREGQWDAAVAGTYGGKIRTRPSWKSRPGREGSSRFSEAVFHHELSSLLVAPHHEQFDAKAWLAANPPDFEYFGTSWRGSPQASRPTFSRTGFVCRYGMASLENDINTYAMYLFTRSDWLLPQAALHPRVRQKLDVLMEFLRAPGSRLHARVLPPALPTSLSVADRQRVEALARSWPRSPSTGRLQTVRASGRASTTTWSCIPKPVQDAEMALEIDPQFAYGHYVRGWAFAHSACWKRRLRISPAPSPVTRRGFPRTWSGPTCMTCWVKTNEAQRDRATAKAIEAARQDDP